MFLLGFFIGGITGSLVMAVVMFFVVQAVENYHFRRVRLMRQNNHWALTAYYRWGEKQ